MVTRPDSVLGGRKVARMRGPINHWLFKKQDDGANNMNCNECVDVCSPSVVIAFDVHTENYPKSFSTNSSLSKIILKPRSKSGKFGCLNIRELLNKHDQIIDLLNECKFYVFGLCETFLDDTVSLYEFDVQG